jgi:dTDP-4-amino-4,6-dideoxygalactose transaminase
MLDLRAQYVRIKDDVDAAVAAVLSAQQFRGGPEVESFEHEMADYVGVAHAIGVSSGTDALFLALKTLGVQSGDEVITTPFTFFATAGAIVNAGAVPVFVDIDPHTFNLDVRQVEGHITPRTRVLLPVHLYGQCADMEPLLAIAEKNGLTVLEDAAQAIGARYHGRAAGSMGRAGAFSFYPTKNLGAAGEGGLVTTNDANLANTLRLLRCHGAGTTYVHEMVGFNSHLQTIQAAILRVKLRHLEAWTAARRDHATYYNKRFAELPEVTVPIEAPGCRHVYHQYVIRIPERDRARELFQRRGIGCGVFYPVPLHRQKCFAHLTSANAACPEAERASREVLALPIFPELTNEQQDEVIAAVRDHLEQL